MLQPLLRRSGFALRPASSQTSRLLVGSWQNARQYSIKPQVASTATPQDIDPSRLVITKSTKPGALNKSEDLIFGKTFTGASTYVSKEAPTYTIPHG
jgi:branched-chain amino acid aminotransferase